MLIGFNGGSALIHEHSLGGANDIILNIPCQQD
jgi:hypothetical protein